MIHEVRKNVATTGDAEVCETVAQGEAAKGHKRKVGEGGENLLVVVDEDCESGLSDLEGVLVKTRKRKKSLALSSTSGLSPRRSLTVLLCSRGNSVVPEEDIASTVTSAEVEEMDHQVGVILSTAGGVESMDYRDVDMDEEVDYRYDSLLRTRIVEVDDDDDEEDDEEVVSPSKYVLSSGRVTQTHQPLKLPTIDDEFEEYFRQLML